jgi:transcriptional accessory protein Tex/SPT6
MKLTLRSLRDEMRNSFGEVHDRIDRTNFRLDEHIKVSNQRFDQIESQMKTLKCEVVQEIKREIVPDLKRELREEITKSVNESMVSTFGRYFVHVEKMLDNHEERIRTLEAHTSP